MIFIKRCCQCKRVQDRLGIWWRSHQAWPLSRFVGDDNYTDGFCDECAADQREDIERRRVEREAKGA